MVVCTPRGHRGPPQVIFDDLPSLLHVFWPIFLLFLVFSVIFQCIFCCFFRRFWPHSVLTGTRTYTHACILVCTHIPSLSKQFLALELIYSSISPGYFSSFLPPSIAISASNPPISAPQQPYKRPHTHSSIHSHSQMYLQRSHALLSP